MKKVVLTLALATALMLPGMAWSKTAAPAAAAPAATSTRAVDFPALKEKALANANKHLAMWQTRLSCVQAATTADAVTACAPAHKHAAIPAAGVAK